MSNGLNKRKKSNTLQTSTKKSKTQRIIALILVLVMIGSMLVGSIFGMII